MKLIVFVIFNIIDMNLILSKNLKLPDIFKGGNYEKNFNPKNITIPINSTNDCSLKDQENFKEPKKNKENLKRKIFNNIPLPKALNDIEREIEVIKVQNGKNLSLEKQILFLASCLKGGLDPDKQILNAYEWALKNNYIRNDKYDDLAKEISKQFKTEYHDDWKIRRSIKQHTCNIISNIKIIFNYNELRNRANKIFNSLKE